ALHLGSIGVHGGCIAAQGGKGGESDRTGQQDGSEGRSEHGSDATGLSHRRSSKSEGPVIHRAPLLLLETNRQILPGGAGRRVLLFPIGATLGSFRLHGGENSGQLR